jgi:hypothetical protein
MSDSLETKNHGPNSLFIRGLSQWLAGLDHPQAKLIDMDSLAAKLQNRRFVLAKPASESEIQRWEHAHHLILPSGLREWLNISNGLVIDGFQWIHPLRSIGPTIRFSPSRSLIIQPSSWYEFGNPNDSPVNLDLIQADLSQPQNSQTESPVFVVGAETEADPPRIIRHSFTDWLIQLARSGFHDDWSSSPLTHLGDPIESHYRRKKPPKLAPRLCEICMEVGEKLASGGDDRTIMRNYQLNRDDLEQVVDAFQYRSIKKASRSTGKSSS